jgi:hypothetical protein
MSKLNNPLHCACLCVALLAAIGSASCASSRVPEPLMGNTNWLSTCDSDDECSDGLSCSCGLCTRECTRSSECGGLTDAVCDTDSDALTAACGRADGTNLCLPECSSELSCGAGLRCVDARCIPSSIAMVDAGTDAGTACEGPNPAGCVQNGCPSGQICRVDPGSGSCTPGSCDCDPETGRYLCTEDCGGGECVEPTEVACGATLQLRDATLEALVRAALEKPSGDILADDVEGLSALDSESLGVDGEVTSLAGIECLRELTSLSISNGQISDLSPLLALPRLRFLTLNQQALVDITPLGQLTALQGLFVAGNQIEDVSPLSSLSAATEIALEDNQIVDITPLEGLDALELLWLIDNPLDCELNADALEALQGSGVEISAPQCL